MNRKETRKNFFSEVEVETVYEDSVSIRGLEIIVITLLLPVQRLYGMFDAAQGRTRVNQQTYDSIIPDFRARQYRNGFFMLSAGNPALLNKTGDMGDMELIYREEHEMFFYDSMTLLFRERLLQELIRLIF